MLEKPLTNLLKKDNYNWSDKAHATFEVLKQAMVSAPILALPNFNDLFVVESDASYEGIRVVLSQGEGLLLISAKDCLLDTRFYRCMKRRC